MQNRKPSYITLCVSLSLSVALFVFLLLGLFGILVPSWIQESSFNYLLAFFLILINLLLNILFMIIEKRNLLTIPEWFRVVFFIGFFVFTGVYYYFGLYLIIYTEIIAYIYLAVVLTILSLSIFFNLQKSDKNVVKTSNAYAAISTFTYSTAMFLIIETIVSAFKIVIHHNNVTNGLLIFLINSCVVILTSLILSIMFYESIKKSKKLINACLIKVNNKTEE